MNQDFFRGLFDYDLHCHLLLANALEQAGDTAPAKAVSLLSHSLNAHHIWISRIHQVMHTFGVDTIHPNHELVSIIRENHAAALQVLEKYELFLPVSYTNLKGEPFSNTVAEILFHLINHSTYHRGQIAMEFRNKGINPPATDYIIYAREKKS